MTNTCLERSRRVAGEAEIFCNLQGVRTVMSGTWKKWMIAGLALAVLAWVGVSLTSDARADDHDEEGVEEAAIAVGTYQQEAAFQNYHRTEELMAFAQELEAEAMEAQQAGDQQKLMDLQAQMQQRQNATIESFFNDIERILPDLARQQNVQVVAVEIQYLAPDIESKDITDLLVEQLNADVQVEDAPE